MAKNDYILSLLAEGEHQRLDYKYAINDSQKIARSLAAFANTDGGVLLIGVRDNGSVAGIRSEEEYYMIEAAAEVYCQPSVPFRAREWHVDGKTILEVKVDSSATKPHRAPDRDGEWRAYVRIDDENILASTVLEMAWSKQASLQGTHLEVTRPVERLLAYLEEHPHITTSQFRRVGRVSYPTAQNILSDLVAIGTLGYKLADKRLVYAVGD